MASRLLRAPITVTGIGNLVTPWVEMLFPRFFFFFFFFYSTFLFRQSDYLHRSEGLVPYCSTLLTEGKAGLGGRGVQGLLNYF